jgi:hypothetical protein
VRYVLQEKLSEDEELDDEGDADDPYARLERQLRRIRRGEPVGDLEVPLPEPIRTPFVDDYANTRH